jgi:hypothetical protein
VDSFVNHVPPRVVVVRAVGMMMAMAMMMLMMWMVKD